MLEGSASCTLDTTSPDDKGVALVISTDDQGPVEITDSTTCTSVPSLGLIAIRVLGAQASAVNVYLPVSVAETGGRAPIVPFVVGKYPTDGAMAEVAQGQYSVGYAVSGYIDVLTSGVASQAAVSIELSATWQRLAMQTTACDAPCTSQLDCGVSDGTGLKYPVCTRAEITDIPVCSLYCDPADTAACTSRGGQCDTKGRCRRPCR